MWRRVLKWTGITIGVFLGLIIAAIAATYAISSAHMNRQYARTDSLVIPTDPVSVARGRHVVEAIGKCAACHGDDYSGRPVADDPAFAILYSANLTRGKGGIGASYTDADYVRTIRYGVKPNGRPVLFMPSEAYAAMSDSDLSSAIAYIKTVPPVDGVRPAPRIGPIARTLYLAGGFPLLPIEQITQEQASLRTTPPGVTAVYGKYLATAGGCRSCHNRSLSGGAKIDGKVLAANITPAGIGRWAEDDFFRALRQGVRPDGRALSAVMPWPYARRMTDSEIKALWLYLRTVPPKKNGEQ